MPIPCLSPQPSTMPAWTVFTMQFLNAAKFFSDLLERPKSQCDDWAHDTNTVLSGLNAIFLICAITNHNRQQLTNHKLHSSFLILSTIAEASVFILEVSRLNKTGCDCLLSICPSGVGTLATICYVSLSLAHAAQRLTIIRRSRIGADVATSSNGSMIIDYATGAGMGGESGGSAETSGQYARLLASQPTAVPPDKVTGIRPLSQNEYDKTQVTLPY